MLPIFDGHNDTLLNLYKPERGGGRSFFVRSDQGHIDLPRAREGGLAGGFFAVFVPAPQAPADTAATIRPDAPTTPPPIEHDYALRETLAMTALLFRLEAQSAGAFKVVRNVAELERCLAQGTLAAILHFEGAEAIDPDLNALEVFYQAGLRSLGLVWSRPNAFAHGVPFAFNQTPDSGPGLTEAGKALVRRCNELGILLDLSHLNAAGFWDVAALSKAPLVATHSNAYALSPSTRNLTDDQLDAIRASGGIVGLNFFNGFLRADGQNDPNTPIALMVEHIHYLVARVGIDGVGLGSDFDGAKVPQAIGDASGLPKLIAALRAAGYDDQALRKIAHENWLRVLRQTWRP